GAKGGGRPASRDYEAGARVEGEAQGGRLAAMRSVSLEIASRGAMRVTRTSGRTSRAPALPGVRPVQAAALSILVLLAPQTAPPTSAASAAPLRVSSLRTEY